MVIHISFILRTIYIQHLYTIYKRCNMYNKHKNIYTHNIHIIYSNVEILAANIWYSVSVRCTESEDHMVLGDLFARLHICLSGRRTVTWLLLM